MNIGIRQNSIEITYTGIKQPMDIFIRQACHRGAYYLYSKTGHFAYKCPNQKAQIKTVLYAITSEERQVQVDKMRELNKSSAEKEQSAKKASFEENFMKAQI